MVIVCEKCGAEYDIPGWLGKIAVEFGAKMTQCDRCEAKERVDEWVQAHRSGSKEEAKSA